jgi:LuxR family maltose regulon positive regulatory protein
MSRASGNINALVDVLGDLAILQTIQGKLNQAAETCREAMQVVEEPGKRRGQKMPVIGPLYVAFGVILREWNELGTALQYAREGVELCQRWGQAPNIFRAYFDLAKTLQVAGDGCNASRAIQDAERVASGLSSWFVDRAAVLKPWQHLMNGNVSAAAQWAQGSGYYYGDQFKFEYYEHYCLLAKILLAEGKIKEAVVLLDKLLKMANLTGAQGNAVEVLAIQALALSGISDHGSEQGKMDSAMLCLEQALALAEPEGYVRVFLDQGQPMRDLLHLLQKQRGGSEYITRLLAAFESRPGHKSEAGHVTNALPEPLSAREQDVLKLLAQGCTDKQIAGTLVIARETVHKHLKNIYGKLGVHSRTEAIARSRELDLL